MSNLGQLFSLRLLRLFQLPGDPADNLPALGHVNERVVAYRPMLEELEARVRFFLVKRIAPSSSVSLRAKRLEGRPLTGILTCLLYCRGLHMVR
jgi:hypothetical protein